MTTPYKRDRNAPRYRVERLLLLSKKELYKRFLTKFPEHAGLSQKDFKAIVKLTHTKMYETAVNERDGIELLEGLGFLFIGTCPPLIKPSFDAISSETHGHKLAYRNLNTDGHIAKIFYTNFASKYQFKDREVWKFTGYRKFKTLVAKTYPENWKQYVQVDNMQKVSELFMKKVNRNVATRLNKIVTNDYNEFEL